MDIDELSTEVLKRIPFDNYTFSIITIEHDHYIHQGKYRDEQRRILTNAGYFLLCTDVLVPIQHDTKPGCAFEDWWCHKDLKIDFEKFTCTGKYPNEIIAKFNQ